MKIMHSSLAAWTRSVCCSPKLGLALLMGLGLALPQMMLAQTEVVTAEVAKLLAMDGDSFDSLGESISLDGNRVAVGAFEDEDGAGFDTGSVYIFERDASGDWMQVQKLLALDASSGDTFGNSVSLDGDFLAIGARREKELGFEAGAAYIFERMPDNTWQQADKLLASDGDAVHRFGESISLEGDRVVVGAESASNGQTNTGAAYVFERMGDGSWQQVEKLLAVDGENGDEFGWAVSLSGDRIAVGAGRGGSGGAAYVFERQADGSWPQVAELSPSDSPTFFGRSLSLEGDRVVVGAWFSTGSAYVFERSFDGSWSETQRLSALDGVSGDQFGYWVALDGDLLAIGANEVSDNGQNSGAVYLFELAGDGSWQQAEKLSPLDGAAGDVFASALSLSGDDLVVASSGDDDNGTDSGSFYSFEPVVVLPQFSIAGSCPGDIEIDVSGVTPRDSSSIYRSSAIGSGSVDSGPCAGTALGLDEPRFARFQNSDFEGTGAITRTVNKGQCGSYLQLVDERTCLVSEVVQVPVK